MPSLSWCTHGALLAWSDYARGWSGCAVYVFPLQEKPCMNRRLLVGLLLIGLHAFVGITLIPDLALGRVGTALAWVYLALSAVLMRYGVLVRGKGNALLAWSGLLAMGIFSSLAIFLCCVPYYWRLVRWQAVSRRALHRIRHLS